MNIPFAFFSPGPWELLIIGVVMVLLFGTRLPTIARSFGQSVTEFKKGMKEIKDEVEDENVGSSKKDSGTESTKKDAE